MLSKSSSSIRAFRMKDNIHPEIAEELLYMVFSQTEELETLYFSEEHCLKEQ